MCYYYNNNIVVGEQVREMDEHRTDVDEVAEGDARGWNIRASRMSLQSRNYIRDIVDHMPLRPNPDKDVIALSIGEPSASVERVR